MKYIGYYRVSTKEQGISGLGLESQKDTVNKYVSSTQGEMLGEYTDIESGTKKERVNLMRAIRHCYSDGAILVVKKLDRLSRGGHQIMSELETLGVRFIECDSPFDNDLVKEIKLSLARDEAKRISERTSSALKVIKDRISRGEKHVSKSGKEVKSLGNPSNLTPAAVQKSVETRRKIALENPDNKRAGAFITALRASGTSFYVITKQLNDSGFRTSRGNLFSEVQAKNIYKLYN